jgi:DNA-binding MarR family transcriptional regulator
MEGYVPKALALMEEVRRLNRQVSAVYEHHLRDAGLDRQRWVLLISLDISPYCLSISDLARVLKRSRQGVHRMVTRLARKGYVEMRPNPDDRRLLQLFLTPRGKSLISDARRQFSNVLRACLLDADGRELLATERVLRKIRMRLAEHEQRLKAQRRRTLSRAA